MSVAFIVLVVGGKLSSSLVRTRHLSGSLCQDASDGFHDSEPKTAAEVCLDVFGPKRSFKSTPRLSTMVQHRFSLIYKSFGQHRKEEKDLLVDCRQKMVRCKGGTIGEVAEAVVVGDNRPESQRSRT